MATGKRYYWFKLKESFFRSDEFDYLMSQPYGNESFIIYQMLCAKTINSHGQLAMAVKDRVIPYTVEKIARDCMYFAKEIVEEAIKLLIYANLLDEKDGIISIVNFDELVGSETDYAEKKRRQRAGGDIVPIEIETDRETDKDIDIDKEKDKDLELKTDREAEKKELPVCPSDGDNKLYISFGNDGYKVDLKMQEELKKSFPHVDLSKELSDINHWLGEKAVHGVSEKNASAFITKWLREAAGKARANANSQGLPRQKGTAVAIAAAPESRVHYDFAEIERLELKRRME